MKEKEENKIQEIIEKENINHCDINFSLGLKKYYINILKILEQFIMMKKFKKRI